LKTITIVTKIAQAGDTRYIPVPYRGTVSSTKLICDAAMVADKTVIFSRGTDAVNTATAPTGNTAAGTVLEGVADTTNKGLVFDPDSSTVTYQVIKVINLAAFVAAGATLTIEIKFDDSAYIQQEALEA